MPASSSSPQPPADVQASPLLDVRGIECRFGKATILRGVRFSIRPGECVALLGSNGAGKSTLLRTCAGLIQPSSGTVAFGGQEYTTWPKTARRRVGLIFQKHQLVPQYSVLTNVVHGRLGFPEGWKCCWQTTAPGWVRRRAMECLNDVGLAHKATQRARSLSGGESQRVAVARALIRSPELIFADEPTASLDPAAGEEVLQLLKGVNRERRVTTILATHDVQRALEFTDRIIGIQAGQVVIDSATRELTPQQLSALYRREPLPGGEERAP